MYECLICGGYTTEDFCSTECVAEFNRMYGGRTVGELLPPEIEGDREAVLRERIEDAWNK